MPARFNRRARPPLDECRDRDSPHRRAAAKEEKRAQIGAPEDEAVAVRNLDALQLTVE